MLPTSQISVTTTCLSTFLYTVSSSEAKQSLDTTRESMNLSPKISLHDIIIYSVCTVQGIFQIMPSYYLLM